MINRINNVNIKQHPPEPPWWLSLVMKKASWIFCFRFSIVYWIGFDCIYATKIIGSFAKCKFCRLISLSLNPTITEFPLYEAAALNLIGRLLFISGRLMNCISRVIRICFLITWDITNDTYLLPTPPPQANWIPHITAREVCPWKGTGASPYQRPHKATDLVGQIFDRAGTLHSQLRQRQSREDFDWPQVGAVLPKRMNGWCKWCPLYPNRRNSRHLP